MKAIKDFKNSLLNRREVKFVVDHSGNPGFENSRKMISEQFKVGEELIAMQNVKGKFGRGTFLIDAYIYNSVADKEAFEQKPKVKKDAAGGK